MVQSYHRTSVSSWEGEDGHFSCEKFVLNGLWGIIGDWGPSLKLFSLSIVHVIVIIIVIIIILIIVIIIVIVLI